MAYSKQRREQHMIVCDEMARCVWKNLHVANHTTYATPHTIYNPFAAPRYRRLAGRSNGGCRQSATLFWKATTSYRCPIAINSFVYIDCRSAHRCLPTTISLCKTFRL
jgi:hypothetical protein